MKAFQRTSNNDRTIDQSFLLTKVLTPHLAAGFGPRFFKFVKYTFSDFTGKKN